MRNFAVAYFAFGTTLKLRSSALFLLLLSAAPCFFAAPVFAAESVKTPHVAATLISSASHFQPGAELVLGVRFEIDEGFHIYYKEPGETGLPTRLELSFSPGEQQFTGDDFFWPEPEKFEYEGVGSALGYKENLLVAIPVSVPDTFDEEQLETSVHLSWLECSDSVCIPRKGAVELSIPQGEAASTAEQEALFERISTARESSSR